jgi:hypothetical protein
VCLGCNGLAAKYFAVLKSDSRTGWQNQAGGMYPERAAITALMAGAFGRPAPGTKALRAVLKFSRQAERATLQFEDAKKLSAARSCA